MRMRATFTGRLARSQRALPGVERARGVAAVHQRPAEVVQQRRTPAARARLGRGLGGRERAPVPVEPLARRRGDAEHVQRVDPVELGVRAAGRRPNGRARAGTTRSPAPGRPTNSRARPRSSRKRTSTRGGAAHDDADDARRAARARRRIAAAGPACARSACRSRALRAIRRASARARRGTAVRWRPDRRNSSSASISADVRACAGAATRRARERAPSRRRLRAPCAGALDRGGDRRLAPRTLAVRRSGRRGAAVGDALAARQPRIAARCRSHGRVARRRRPTAAAPEPSRCSRPGRARRRARSPVHQASSTACMRLARRRSRRPGTPGCRSCSRCSAPRRRARRRAAPPSPHAGSSGSGARPVSAASAAIVASPPGGQRLIGAPSCAIARA